MTASLSSRIDGALLVLGVPGSLIESSSYVSVVSTSLGIGCGTSLGGNDAVDGGEATRDWPVIEIWPFVEDALAIRA